VLSHDLSYRRARIMRMGPGAAQEFSTMLAAACSARARLTLFFPPDNLMIQARYAQGDANGLERFKQQVSQAVAQHNQHCASKASLFDFLNANPLTRETLQNGSAANYVDLVHFRPPAGLWLLRQMGVTGG
jgi:hypothetical protein